MYFADSTDWNWRGLFSYFSGNEPQKAGGHFEIIAYTVVGVDSYVIVLMLNKVSHNMISLKSELPPITYRVRQLMCINQLPLLDIVTLHIFGAHM